MSQENVEIARELAAAFNRRDLETVAERTTDDYEFIPTLAGTVESTSYRGVAGLSQYFEDVDEVWETIQIQIDEIRDLGDSVVQVGELIARGRSSGLDVRYRRAWLAEFRDGKVRRVRSFADESEAREAVEAGE
jgi:ketosteroid isomerase-like protein